MVRYKKKRTTFTDGVVYKYFKNFGQNRKTHQPKNTNNRFEAIIFMKDLLILFFSYETEFDETCLKWDFYNSLFFSFTAVTTIGNIFRTQLLLYKFHNFWSDLLVLLILFYLKKLIFLYGDFIIIFIEFLSFFRLWSPSTRYK